jgi:hypothetical protein
MFCSVAAVLIASTLTAQAAEPEEHLKDLAWLIGDWECIEELKEDAPFGKKGDTFALKGSHRWILGKSAIQFDWTIEVNGEQVAQGRALVAWDGTTGEVMEWAVTNGGTNSGPWRQEGDTWVYSAKGFSEAGKTSSDTVYTDISRKGATFQIVNRVEDGKKLEDTARYVYKRVERPGRKGAARKKATN